MTLSPRLQKLVDMGESGTNILHGELKNLMLECENKLSEIGDSDNIADKFYHEGMLDAYAIVYQLTYELAFAIGERREARG
jgi:glutamine cyclotransferase